MRRRAAHGLEGDQTGGTLLAGGRLMGTTLKERQVGTESLLVILIVGPRV